MPDLDYQDIIDRSRALTIEPYKSLAEVGFEGPWVTPYQITSKSSDGPVLVALHWLDEPAILRERPTLQDLGYLPNIRFNLSLIHISEPTRLGMISYAVFCLKKKKKKKI